jgi:hypothetical protein
MDVPHSARCMKYGRINVERSSPLRFGKCVIKVSPCQSAAAKYGHQRTGGEYGIGTFP